MAFGSVWAEHIKALHTMLGQNTIFDHTKQLFSSVSKSILELLKIGPMIPSLGTVLFDNGLAVTVGATTEEVSLW